MLRYLRWITLAGLGVILIACSDGRTRAAGSIFVDGRSYMVWEDYRKDRVYQDRRGQIFYWVDVGGIRVNCGPNSNTCNEAVTTYLGL